MINQVITVSASVPCELIFTLAKSSGMLYFIADWGKKMNAEKAILVKFCQYKLKGMMFLMPFNL
jgi:hypothetical protein